MTIYMLITTLIIVAVLSAFIFGYFRERRIWNNGLCKDTNFLWVYYDTDSSGARLYKSTDLVSNKTYYCAISYPFID